MSIKAQITLDEDLFELPFMKAIQQLQTYRDLCEKMFMQDAIVEKMGANVEEQTLFKRAKRRLKEFHDQTIDRGISNGKVTCMKLNANGEDNGGIHE